MWAVSQESEERPVPAFDPASHETPEDLRVLRDALGPARREPLHAAAMRAALSETKAARRLALETARRRIAVARRVARERACAAGG